MKKNEATDDVAKVPRKLSENQVANNADELANLIDERERVLEEKREANAEYRKKLAYYDERLTELAFTVRTKTQMVPSQTELPIATSSKGRKRRASAPEAE